ncbi:MAG: hypothetical protein ACI3U2_01430 [Anaerovibrio sp.]
MSISIAAFIVGAIGMAIACISFGYQPGKDVAKNQK